MRSPARIHVELREASSGELETLAPAVEQAISKLPGVRWAAVNAWLHWLIVGVDPASVCNDIDGKQNIACWTAFEDRLVAAVEAVEEQQGLGKRNFPARAYPEQHPGDGSPLLRTGAEVLLNAGVLVTAPLIGRRRAPIELALSAFIEVFKHAPHLRAVLERRVGVAAAEMMLESAGAALQILQGNRSGATVRVVYRSLRLRELAARRRTWRRWEARLAQSPQRHRRATARCRQRRRPLREGPIEHYLEQVVPGVLGAFTGTLLATRHPEHAAAAVFGGLPRPARHARNSFASQLCCKLSLKGALVMDPRVLRLLDRLDTVAIDGALHADGEGVSGLLAAAEAAGLQCVMVGREAPAQVRWRNLRYLAEVSSAAIMTLQDEGAAVLFIHEGRDSACAGADCDIAVRAWNRESAWGAHVLLAGGLDQAAFLVEAVGVARLASEQALALSMAEVAFAAVLSSAGFDEARTRQIALAGNVAGLLAVSNSLRLLGRLHWPEKARRHPDDGPAARQAWHAMSADAVLDSLRVRREGLSAVEAAARRTPDPPEPTALGRVLHALAAELDTPLVPVLAAGAALSLLAGSPVDAALIALVLVIDAGYGGLQHHRAERTIRQLLQREKSRVWVRRSGERQQVGVADLVPGDIVEFCAGQLVPADCRILDADSVEIDESSLTGESFPVSKGAEASQAESVAERTSMLYAGTAAVAGKGLAVVVAVGADTEAGRASQEQRSIAALPQAGAEARLHELTQQTLPVAASAALMLAVFARQRGRSMAEALSLAASLAVAAVPEGLPLLSGVAQAVAAERLSHRGALVRNSQAVEALGRIDVLCCDKTGTLTEGRIRLQAVSDGEALQKIDGLDAGHRHVLAAALRASPSSSSGEPVSHATDQALIDGARAIGVTSHDGLNGWQRLDQMPFQSSRAFHAGLAEHVGGRLISVKGAPEVVLERCASWQQGDRTTPIDEALRQQLNDQAKALAQQGYRVLAVAERSAGERPSIDEKCVSRLGFLGFVTFADTARPTARDAIAQLRQAGIRLVMLTGDHPLTAASVAADLGLDVERPALTGADIDRLDDQALVEAIADVQVFARVTPSHKVRIVRALRASGRAVGMTGDGANDAAAIRLADAGIAVGEHSTAAAQGAADLIVPDGRIETLVACVLEGRALWRGLRSASSLILGGNLGEVLFTLVSGATSGTAAFNARQLLLLNLVSDTLPALALALRPGGGLSASELLRAGPEGSLGESLRREIVLRAAATATSAGLSWGAALLTGGRAKGNSVALLALAGSQMFQAAMLGRGDRRVLLSSLATGAAMVGIVETPALSRLFGCRPIGPIGLAQAFTGASVGALAQWLLPRFTGNGRDAKSTEDRNVAGPASVSTISPPAEQASITGSGRARRHRVAKKRRQGAPSKGLAKKRNRRQERSAPGDPADDRP